MNTGDEVNLIYEFFSMLAVITLIPEINFIPLLFYIVILIPAAQMQFHYTYIIVLYTYYIQNT